MSHEESDPKSSKPLGMWIAIGLAIGAALGITFDNFMLDVVKGLH